jgi:hypothetical protein
MNTNPINLAVRFLLEITMLVILACWGWHLFNNWMRILAAAALPLAAAALWGIFRIPNDPKPAPVAIPGLLRLLLELGLFAFATWILFKVDYPKTAFIFACITVLHYIISYDRTWAMLCNRPYNGFVKNKTMPDE